jgi:hypothetical protein
MQYLESIVTSPVLSVPILPHASLSANLAESAPGRTAFISWILRIVCTFGACAPFLTTYLYKDFTMPQGVSASQSVMDKIHTAVGNSSKPKGRLLVFLPSAPFPAYIRIPLNFIISVACFSIPWSYLEQIKVASNYHGRVSAVQDIWDQYTRRIVKEYQDFLLIVRLAHLPSSLSGC